MNRPASLPESVPDTTEFYVKVTISTERLLSWAKQYAEVTLVAPEVAAGLFAHSLVPPFSMTELSPEELRLQFVSMLTRRA